MDQLESLNAPLFSKGKVKSYRCTLINQECTYVPNIGAGDCRRCNFALAFLLAHPDHIQENISEKR